MRKNIVSFASGAIAMLLLMGLSVTALAANGAIKIEVSPIKVMVNGEIFKPKDASGNDVMVFTYNGTTYAPLRALAEAYGLEVGYDAESRIATVNAKYTAGTNSSNIDSGTLIGEEKAKSAALAHAELQAAQVTFVSCNLEWENGHRVYEVEFYTASGQEYDYEIDAYTAKVLGVDYDAEGYTPNGHDDYIGEERARSIALEKIPGANTNHVRKLKLDYNDGRWIYEVEIYYNGMEYEGEIDANTGKVLKWEAERD